jgi:hypothetical protein
MRETVAFAALITWFVGVLAGLYMLTVWLIENDVTARRSAPSRLPAPVIFTHLTLAVGGLALWAAYLIWDRDVLAWAAFGLLCVIEVLGLTMFARWIPVYREPVPAVRPGQLPDAATTVPAEGNFPVAVVATHGLLAGLTTTLVLLSALGVGGS